MCLRRVSMSLESYKSGRRISIMRRFEVALPLLLYLAAIVGPSDSAGVVYRIFQLQALLSSTPSTDTTTMRLPPSVCDEPNGFLRRQRKLCQQHFRLMESVIRGYFMGLGECQHQFSQHRWNCQGYNITVDDNLELNNRKRKKRERTYMDRLVTRGTREAAYVLAVTSAGVSHAVTKACSSGVHEHCGCDRTIYDHPRAPNFKWSGCSDNIHFGAAFTRQFLDVQEKKKVPRNPKLGLTNLHNNHVGRQIVMNKMGVQCKCHGVSGSCELQTCWRSLPKFRDVGTHLNSRFEEAMEVDYVDKRLVPKYHRSRMFSESDLIYVTPSPTFCKRDPKHGSLGTSGRQCNETSYGPDGCESLCCGRGFIRRTTVRVEKCDCKFYWCCEVRCNTCERNFVIATCK